MLNVALMIFILLLLLLSLLFESFRLSIEVQRHVKQSGKFENLSQGGLRLTHLIERYEMLYSQGRLDALDELEELPQLNKMKKKEDIKHKIMAGIMVVSRLFQIYKRRSSSIYSYKNQGVFHSSHTWECASVEDGSFWSFSLAMGILF